MKGGILKIVIIIDLFDLLLFLFILGLLFDLHWHNVVQTLLLEVVIVVLIVRLSL